MPVAIWVTEVKLSAAVGLLTVSVSVTLLPTSCHVLAVGPPGAIGQVGDLTPRARVVEPVRFLVAGGVGRHIHPPMGSAG